MDFVTSSTATYADHDAVKRPKKVNKHKHQILLIMEHKLNNKHRVDFVTSSIVVYVDNDALKRSNSLEYGT